MITKLCCLIFVTLLLFGCSVTPSSDWTILVYMAADNSLTEDAIRDIIQMQKGEFTDNINVIVQIDSREDNLFGHEPGGVRYKISPDAQSDTITSNVVELMGPIDSGDYRTLAQFANWGYDKYPSRKRALVIWSHGSGWQHIPAQFCPDASTGSFIDIAQGELREAMQMIRNNIDILMMDACGMQTVEVLSELNGEVSYVIASEIEMPFSGFPYHDILTNWEDYTSSVALAESIALDYINSYFPGGSQFPGSAGFPLSISVMNTEKLAHLQTAITDFCDIALQYSEQDVFIQARDQIQFSYNPLDTDVDVKDYFLKLQALVDSDELENAIQTVLDEIESAFPLQLHIVYPDDYSHIAGSALIWFPTSISNFHNWKLIYENLNFAEVGWIEFLENILMPEQEKTNLTANEYPVNKTLAD